MARNYQISEAVEIIAEGTDAEALQDLGRRYPLLVAKVAKATSGSNVREVVELFSYMPDYLSANKVNKSIKEAAGLVEGKGADNDDEVEEKPVKKVSAKRTAAKKTTSDPYAGKDAIELFKECKKRGIKAAAKKTAKFYANLLKKADEEAAAEAEEAEADDDWDDDDEEEEAPAPKKKATAKKAAKKAEPEDDDDDDDDDDWDI